MIAYNNETFGLIKTLVDAHTMGINSAASLLRDSGYRVLISPENVAYAMERISVESSQQLLLKWIKENHIVHVGFSYRLDPDTAVDIMGRFIYMLRKEGYYGVDNALVRSIFFAGLVEACEMIDKEYDGIIKTFRGGETAEETLLVMGVPLDRIPEQIKAGCQYDKELARFGSDVIKRGEYYHIKPPFRKKYSEFGSMRDTLQLRLESISTKEPIPIIRAHAGPFSENKSRNECLKEFMKWCRILGKTGFLDVLSIGTSQLSQSNFGERWDDRINGGGVPVNSESEYHDIWLASRPMLVRTYSGTKDLLKLAGIYERSINISWHALSLWWFDELDGRGPNSLYCNLNEHVDTIRYAVSTGKPVETNVPHHFAFRGADDITYIVSEYLAAKTAKKCGVKTFILQNMLNTPRSTWGIQDLAKSRTMLKLVKELEDNNFHVILQTRAGLDYFKPDLESAKAQLASVTALMDDIDPLNTLSPEIIHVVSYSEALFLANPDIINDSIKITLAALMDYRKMKKQELTPNVMTEEINKRQVRLEQSCRIIIKAMEDNIPELYSPSGLYLAFVAGWLPVPELWSDSKEFAMAKGWSTRNTNGSMELCDKNMVVTDDDRINRCIHNIQEACRLLRLKKR